MAGTLTRLRVAILAARGVEQVELVQPGHEFGGKQKPAVAAAARAVGGRGRVRRRDDRHSRFPVSVSVAQGPRATGSLRAAQLTRKSRETQ